MSEKNSWPYVDGTQYVAGATIWAYEGGEVTVVPWERHFGSIESGYFGPGSMLL